jgi:hypothetical protein
MNPVPVTTLLFINSLVQQCKHKNFPLQGRYFYWWVEGAAANGSAARGKDVAVFSRAAGCNAAKNRSGKSSRRVLENRM